MAASNLQIVQKPLLTLHPALLLRIHDFMVKNRKLEERLIKMFKQSEGYFWIGSTGEEAFSVPLGLLVKKGQGLNHDYLHLHYRSSAVLLTLGMEPIDAIRQMRNTATDPFSGGRNFGGHASRRSWNVVPITSTIETQYVTAIGTGLAQKRHSGDSITIVTGGDAGTAEGDFTSCLVWASRPGHELPLLIIVTNNTWGISTPYETQHGEKFIADRAKAFGIRSKTINGNDVEESYNSLREAIEYVRTSRRPYMLEAKVSRLYGHSSATGANFVTNEEDPLQTFEDKLENTGLMSRAAIEQLHEKYDKQMFEFYKQVKAEPMPDPTTIYDYTYCGQKGRYF